MLERLKTVTRRLKAGIVFGFIDSGQMEIHDYLKKFKKQAEVLNGNYFFIKRRRNKDLLKFLTTCSIDITGHPLPSGPGFFSGLWLESGYSFILFKKDRPASILFGQQIPIACITFEIHENVIFIKQIQGGQGQQENLKPIRWEKMLVVLIIDWARHEHFKEVQIMEASQNWYYSNRKQIFKLRYNKTAERLGFKFDPEKHAYVLKLAK